MSSPPYAEALGHGGQTEIDDEKGIYTRREFYGSQPGQLGSMKAQGFDAAISSPPFLQSEGGAHVPSHYADDSTFMARHAAGNKSSNAYGKTDGQLSSMSGDGFDAAVSSPPFENSLSRDFIDAKTRREIARSKGVSNAEFISPIDADRLKAPDEVYGITAGQLGNDSGDDFWLAARTIVEQVYLALAPGGHAVWVVKDYVKNKQIVPFADQWRQLCEAVGFTTLHEHRAMLVHHKGTQHTMDGGTVEYKTESKSFFRRLAEKKGSPRIDWETVYCMEKRK